MSERKAGTKARVGSALPRLLFLSALLAGIFALSGDDAVVVFDDEEETEPEFADGIPFGPEEEGVPPQFADFDSWIPPAPPRWFRSNAGGMALDETPSRLVALRNRYALVKDYVSPRELDPMLRPFFDDDMEIEIRILFDEGLEARRQWIFVDSSGITRLNAVFRKDFDGDAGRGEERIDFRDELIEVYGESGETADGIREEATDSSGESAVDTGRAPVGFIEVFDVSGRITGDRLFDLDGRETVTWFFYNEDRMVRAETRLLDGGESRELHTDHFRYNRAGSLRHISRVFAGVAEPVREDFPVGLLDAAFRQGFTRGPVLPGSEFMRTLLEVGEGYTVSYELDARGRTLVQTLLDDEGEVIWELRNTWDGDRIAAILRIEGGEERLSEYEFDDGGERILLKESLNGVLQRQVRREGDFEIEELFLEDVLVLRAYWQDGRKVSEERVASGGR
ncbi:MAG: hypothetical protein FWD94_01505 [Treponema sp.]|nr:hypothetical protein [Treponema sp.]